MNTSRPPRDLYGYIQLVEKQDRTIFKLKLVLSLSRHLTFLKT